MNPTTRRLLFLLFFVSGFCSLVYQVVWTRMAFASFGIITPVLSVVLSVFMLGLSLGSWLGGRLIAGLVRRTRLSAAVFYAGLEFLIGLGAFVVPGLFSLGERFLLATGQTDSFGYLGFSALVLAGSILPWCVFMGATFPFMMAYVRDRDASQKESFSYLYLANVLGAMSGTFFTAIVFVELLGFRRTLSVAAGGNFMIAFISAWLGWRQQGSPSRSGAEVRQWEMPAATAPLPGARGRLIKWILFATGFSAMAMEVVWTRAFVPVLRTQVYSFAMIVFAYLGATFLGSLIYRRDLRWNTVRSTPALIAMLSVAAFLPMVINDPRFVNVEWLSSVAMYYSDSFSSMLVLASICPLCAVLGYLTPRLIDEYAAGRPADAGRAYAINVVGCILGPLFASYLLLPLLGERPALILLSLSFVGFYLLCWKSLNLRARLLSAPALGAVFVWTLCFAGDFENMVGRLEKHMTVRRDYAASVISFGDGLGKRLLVNGVGMTVLTPITKFMVDLPLAFHTGPPRSALIICFGMGTTYRSALNWNIDTTAVELVPSVTRAFSFYHADATNYLHNPNGHIVIDDGRRYLKRVHEKYDVIVLDPPPPPEAAGSSLLYSKEFYALAKQHLNTNGILQAWFPGGEPAVAQAVYWSVHDSFPFVRCFGSVSGGGIHILASLQPIEERTGAELAARMPAAAQADLLEWSSGEQLPDYLQRVVSREIPASEIPVSGAGIRITDDRPFNEYFLMRRHGLFHP